MAVCPVLKMGDPRLLEIAEAVESFDTPETHALIRDMHDSMHALNGVGLTAPQIGIGLRVVIFGVQENPRYPEAEEVSETVLINPEIEVVDEGVEEGWEGCLSLPGLRGLVPRCRKIRYRGMDAAGRCFERVVEGFHARVVQHECDHLDGILYPMRMRDMSKFGFEDVLAVTPDSGLSP